jgi:hypothetical protein
MYRRTLRRTVRALAPRCTNATLRCPSVSSSATSRDPVSLSATKSRRTPKEWETTVLTHLQHSTSHYHTHNVVSPTRAVHSLVPLRILQNEAYSLPTPHGVARTGVGLFSPRHHNSNTFTDFFVITNVRGPKSRGRDYSEQQQTQLVREMWTMSNRLCHHGGSVGRAGSSLGVQRLRTLVVPDQQSHHGTQGWPGNGGPVGR